MEILKKLSKKLKDEWNSLYKWVKVILIIIGIFFIYLILISLKNLLFWFGDFIGRIFGIPN